MTTYAGASAAILSNYSYVLKTFYLPAIQEQLNHGTPLADKIDTNEKDVSGTDATINMHYGRTTGIGARADGGALPDPDYQKHITATVPMKYNYGRITVSGPTIAATRDEKGAYARALDNEITGLVRDMKKEINRQLWGCGYGILARWRSGTTTSMTVQKQYFNNSAGGDGFGSTFGGKYFKDGMTLCEVVIGSNIGSATNGTYSVTSTDLTVSAITESSAYDTLTITNASVTEAAGTFWVRPGNLGSAAASGGGRHEMMGLRGIVTDTDLDDIAFTTDAEVTTGIKTTYNDPLQGLAASSYTWWQAQVKHSSAGRYEAQRNLTFKLMQEVFDAIEEEVGEGVGPNMILTTRAIRREYLDLCETNRRTVNMMELDGGWTAVDYNGIPLMVDSDAIDGEMYFLTTQFLQIYRMSDYDWMDKDGSILSRVSGYDAYEATLFRYAELGCTSRRAQGVLCDLAYET